MAPPLELSSTQLNAWIGAYAWPFARIAALVGAAPLFGTRTVPVRVRLAIALALTAAVAPILPALPALEPLSLASLNVTVQQVLIGLGLGFALRLAFAALEIAGEAIGQSMGLGFASLVDPQNGTPVPAVSQFYTLMATLLFFALNGHWTMIEILVESFRSFPVGASVASAAWADLVALGAEQLAREASLNGRAEGDIAAASQQAIAAIYEQAAGLSTQIAGRILQREIDPAAHQALVNESLQQLSTQRN